MTIDNKEVSTGEINLKTTKDLIQELTIKIATYFTSAGYVHSWPNGIGETLTDLNYQLSKLEALYIDGLQEGDIKGYERGINDTIARFSLGTNQIQN